MGGKVEADSATYARDISYEWRIRNGRSPPAADRAFPPVID
jgi:hypothetical protein